MIHTVCTHLVYCTHCVYIMKPTLIVGIILMFELIVGIILMFELVFGFLVTYRQTHPSL